MRAPVFPIFMNHFQDVRLVNGYFNISCDILVNPPVPDHNITWELQLDNQGKAKISQMW